MMAKIIKKKELKFINVRNEMFTTYHRLATGQLNTIKKNTLLEAIEDSIIQLEPLNRVIPNAADYTDEVKMSIYRSLKRILNGISKVEFVPVKDMKVQYKLFKETLPVLSTAINADINFFYVPQLAEADDLSSTLSSKESDSPPSSE